MKILIEEGRRAGSDELKPHEIILNFPEPSQIATLVSLSQIIANTAVFVVIIIGILQLRSSQSAAASTAEQFHTQAMNEFWMTLAADSDLAFIYQTGRKNPDSLSEKNRARFFYTCTTWFALQELMFVQSKSGHVSDRFYDDWKEAIEEDLLDRGFKEYWAAERIFFDSEFREFFDSKIGTDIESD